MDQPPQHHVEAARLLAKAVELLDEAASLLANDYDDMKKETLVEGISQACSAAIDWIIP